MLEVRGLNAHYGSSHVLRGVDLTIAAVGIVFMVVTAALVLYAEIGVRVLGLGS